MSALLDSRIKRNSPDFEQNTRRMVDLLTEIKNEESRLQEGGGTKAVEAQHKKGRLTARERTARLIDPGTQFFELGIYAAYEMYQEWGGAPAAGTITKLEYKPGKFLAAWDERTSLENEQNIFTQATEHGEIVYKQIAGWVARRCISWKKAGDAVARGERIGLVRFGSRMDVWLPGEPEIAVRVGQNVKGGSSVLARMRDTAKVRRGGPGGRSLRTNQKMQEDQGS